MQQTLRKQAKPAADAQSSLIQFVQREIGVFSIVPALSMWVLKKKIGQKNIGKKEVISTHNFKFGSTSEAGQGWLLLSSSWRLTGN